MKHSNVKSTRSSSAIIGGENNRVHGVRGATSTSIIGFIKYCFSDSGNRTHRFLLIFIVGALVTVVNIAAYLHYHAAVGNGGEAYNDGGDGDGLAGDAHEFIEAHKNKKLFSAHQQKEGDSSPSAERRVKQDKKEEGNSQRGEKHVKRGGRGEKKGKKGSLVEAPPATNQKPSSKRRGKRGGKHGDTKEALSAPPAIFLDSKDNNVISVDHDRNEVQSAHLVASLGGSLGGGNGKPHKRLPYPSSSSSTSSRGKMGKIKLPAQWGIGNGQQPTEKSVVSVKKIKLTTGSHNVANSSRKDEEEGKQYATPSNHAENGRKRASVDGTDGEKQRAVADDKKKEQDDEKDRDNAEEETRRKEKHRQRKHKAAAAAAQKENDEGEREKKYVSNAGAAGEGGNVDDHNDEDASERRRHKKKRRGKNDSHNKKKKNEKRGTENGGEVEEEKEENTNHKVPHINDAASSSSSFPVVEEGASNNTLARDFTKARLSFDASVSAYYEHQKENIAGGVEQSSNRFTDIHEAPGNGVLLPTGTRRDLEERFGLRSQLPPDANRAEKKREGLEVDDPAQPALESKAARGPGNPSPRYIFSQRLGSNKNNSNNEKGAEEEVDDSPISVHDPSFNAAYCDPTDADFTPESDAACMSYLTDIRNMQSIKVMSSVLSTGRTIKMKVFYRHNNVEAVLKVSQKKFQLEPVSEVMAFHTDRVLGFNRVPPVVWTPIPLDFLRAAAAQVSSFYSQWLQQFAIDYDTSKPLISKCFLPASGKTDHRQSKEGEHGPLPPHSGQCLNVSLQLWLFDVHDAEDTRISPPRRYRHLLNIPFPADDDNEEGKAGKERRGGGVIVRKRGKGVQHGFAAETTTLASSSSSSSENEKSKAAAIITSSERSLIENSYLRIAVSELMDQFVFDYVVGNSDRWFGHNSFALGASLLHGRSPADADDEKKRNNGHPQLLGLTTVRYAKPSEIRTVSSPRLAYIDQGSAFYGRSGPEMNPFTKNTGPFCRFKKSTVENFLSVIPASASSSSSSSSFEEEEARPPPARSKGRKDSEHPIVAKLVKSRLPKGVFYLSTNSLLKAAGQRAEKIAAHMRECLANFSAADVMYF